MRLFEILLLLCCITLLGSLIYKKTSQKASFGICAAAGIILIIQLLYEGYRWQLFFIYLITVLLIIIAMIKCRKCTLLVAHKPLKYILCTLSLLLIALSSFLSLYLPVFNLPKPSGSYKIGTETFHFIDNNRNEVLSKNKNAKRELMVQVWYPAEDIIIKKQTSVFPESKNIFEKYKKEYSKNLKLPAFVFDYWKYIKSNSYKDAKISTAKKNYPLVIINHGLGTSSLLHYSQAENLASHGYIVAAIDHTYSTTATAFPNGKVTGFETNFTEDEFMSSIMPLGDMWTEDVNFTIDQLTKINSDTIKNKFSDKIDLNNIGIMGHSFGGATAFNAFYLNDKIKAGINMDGSLYEVDNKENITKPFMFMESENSINQNKKYSKNTISDGELKSLKLSREKYNRIADYYKKENNIINSVSSHGGCALYIKDTAHYNYTDFQLYSRILSLTGMTGRINGKRGEVIVNQYVMDFFNKYLKETGGELIDKESSKYPEVTFEK